MTWSWADYLIVGFGVLNLAVLVAVGIAVRKVLRGPVSGTMGRIGSLTATGVSFAEAGKKVFFANKDRLLALVTRLSSLRRLLHIDAFLPSPEGATVTYQSLMKALVTVRSARAGWGEVQRLVFRQRKRTSPAAVTPPPKPSLAMRMGLIPPAARHLPAVLRVWRIARNVLVALRQRGAI